MDQGNNYYNTCCTTPLPNAGVNTFTNPPAIVNLAGGDFHLSPSSPCINAGNNSFVTVSNDLDGNPRIIGGTVDMGAYEFQSPIHFVDVNSTNPVPPYTDWSTASTDIQSAVDASTNGDLVLVNDGLYNTGGRVVYGTLTNRVVINKAVTVQSVNGPAATMIQGNPCGWQQCSALCFMTNNAVMSGFTLESGSTRSSALDPTKVDYGGGVWCESTNAVITNCVLVGNSAFYYGGGAFSGTLENCVLQTNSANSGDGSCSNTLINCLLTGNSAKSAGGGALSSLLNNCLIISNSAILGGGAAYSTLGSFQRDR